MPRSVGSAAPSPLRWSGPARLQAPGDCGKLCSIAGSSRSGRCATSRCSGSRSTAVRARVPPGRGAVRPRRRRDPACGRAAAAPAAWNRWSRGRTLSRGPEAFRTTAFVVDAGVRVERFVGFEMAHHEVGRERAEREPPAGHERGGEAADHVELRSSPPRRPKPPWHRQMTASNSSVNASSRTSARGTPPGVAGRGAGEGDEVGRRVDADDPDPARASSRECRPGPQPRRAPACRARGRARRRGSRPLARFPS